MNAKTVKIDICLCTFQRPHVVQTLRCLNNLTVKPEWQVRIIVADNDDTPSAKERVEETARSICHPVTYIHAPSRNISIARNACLNAATAPYIAFIDDDELAQEKWLVALMEEQNRSHADVVLGPVQAVYNATAPAWMKTGYFHSTMPVWVNDEIITGYSCNVLFKQNVTTLKTLRFRHDLGRTGGEDTVFFSIIHKAGGIISFAPDALINEAVPENRATLSWLLKRRFRSGQTHGLLLIENNEKTAFIRLKQIFLTTAKAGFCALTSLALFWNAQKMYFWLLRTMLHIGVIFRLLGKRELEQYGMEQ